MNSLRLTVFWVAFWLCFSSPVLAEKKSSWWLRSEKEAATQGYFLATVQEVLAMSDSVKDLLIVDVRPDYEFAMGHIPKAVNLEFHLGDRLKVTDQKKASLISLLGKDRQRPVVIYCRSYS